jgi:cytochrome c oxidase cbb3-type subunit II
MIVDFYKNHRFLYAVIFFGFIGLTLIIAIGPALWVQDHNRPLPGSRALNEQEQRGLAVYVAEGCLYCHTQQVRPLDVDAVFGRPSAPGDYARLKPQDMWRMTPGMLGTERTGPDLSNVGNRQPSETWQYIHLYNPRAVVRESVMQAYTWLFETKQKPKSHDVVVSVPKNYAPPEGTIVATEKAKDLVAYLLSLKQVPIPGATTMAHPQPPSTSGAEASHGGQVYASHCASCHQQNGEGLAGVFPPLKGNPVVIDRDPAEHIRVVLFGLQGKAINGISYQASMPAHAQLLSDLEIAAVINHERTSWGNNAPTVVPKDVEKIRQQGGRYAK